MPLYWRTHASCCHRCPCGAELHCGPDRCVVRGDWLCAACEQEATLQILARREASIHETVRGTTIVHHSNSLPKGY